MRPSLLTWLCILLSAGLPRWCFLALLPLSCFKRVWHRFLGCPILVVWSCSRSLSLSLKLVFCRLEICNILPGDCAAVCSRSASLYPATELRSARGRYVLDPAASHRVGHLCLLLHLWSHCNFLFLKLFDITSTRCFQGVLISPWTSLL